MEVLNWMSDNGFGLVIAAIIIGPSIGYFILEIIKELKR